MGKPRLPEDDALAVFGVIVILCVLVALLTSCAYANAKSHWPSRGAFMCVTNHTTEPLTVVARDGQGRALDIMRRLGPGERRIARWPFIHTQGMLLAGPYATMQFAPWEYDQYTWIIGPASTVIPGYCR